MADNNALDEDVSVPRLDFSSEPFTTQREPLKDLVNTFSELYIDSEEEEERIEDNISVDNLPPPPLDGDEVPGHNPFTSVTSLIEKLTGRITSLEGRLEECIQGVSNCASHAELEAKCKANEERANYHIARECERTKKQLEVTIQDLGQSMVDCLKQRDLQIDQKIRLFVPAISTR